MSGKVVFSACLLLSILWSLFSSTEGQTDLVPSFPDIGEVFGNFSGRKKVPNTTFLEDLFLYPLIQIKNLNIFDHYLGEDYMNPLPDGVTTTARRRRLKPSEDLDGTALLPPSVFLFGLSSVEGISFLFRGGSELCVLSLLGLFTLLWLWLATFCSFMPKDLVRERRRGTTESGQAGSSGQASFPGRCARRHPRSKSPLESIPKQGAVGGGSVTEGNQPVKFRIGISNAPTAVPSTNFD
uniref:Uncharacterized protein n=1 Tax=Chromera velia CCMP2878 TaxID=1169474 RepID=A0A0G4GCJ4_9ALVE|eukprot:Cvel_21323.t1-p1 / transcript=Cvel_21323.t1 / gene=Cvel_21323 / organism=Chromera_velia_CCMP2878 / gene_product=hypothetical protein / transcript_product=hypothetical protein / location=Cvel_scaffold1988:23113-24959(-) / protein_length=238 / sequence_SO=supercontig / SO=protein_coding / is_pseudo=false